MAKIRMAKGNDSGLDFEAQLWAAADKMRGHMLSGELCVAQVEEVVHNPERQTV